MESDDHFGAGRAGDSACRRFGRRGDAITFPRRLSASARPVMTNAQQVERLFRRFAETRDLATREQLIRMNRGLAIAAAQRFAGSSGEPLEDLIQVALLGLVNAVDRFDTAAGTRFSTFATITILGEVARYLRDRSAVVRLPRRQQELARAAGAAGETLSALLGRAPTYAEIAAHLGVSEEAVLEAVAVAGARSPYSLDAAPGPGMDGFTMYDVLGSEDALLQRLVGYGDLYDAVHRLPERERRVVLLRFFAGLSQRGAAERLETSQMQVSRLERRALERLRAMLDHPFQTGFPSEV